MNTERLQRENERIKRINNSGVGKENKAFKPSFTG